MRSRVMLTGVAVCCAVGVAAPAQAQISARGASVASAAQLDAAAGPYTLTVAGGGFAYSFDADNRMFPFASVGLSRSLTRFAAVEARGGYANTAAESINLATFEARSFSEPMITGDVVLLAQLPVWRFTPYAGVTGGLLYQPRGSHYGGKSVGAPGTSTGALTGLKLALWRRVGVRGEMAYRHDRYFLRNNPMQNYADGNNVVFSFGVTWGL